MPSTVAAEPAPSDWHLQIVHGTRPNGLFSRERCVWLVIEHKGRVVWRCTSVRQLSPRMVRRARRKLARFQKAVRA